MDEATKRHDETLYGKDGICATVTKMEVVVETIQKDVSSLSTSFAALAKSQLEQDIHKKAQIEIDENMENRRIEANERRHKRRIYAISIISVLIPSIITIIIKT